MNKSYVDKTECPKGHKFSITRRMASSGKITPTLCRECQDYYPIMAGLVPTGANGEPGGNITQAILKDALTYDPETGIFTNKRRRIRCAEGAVCGQRHSEGYIYISLYGKRYFAHRLAILYMTGEYPEDDVDHINGIRDDNRYINLRVVTRSVNMQNQRQPRSHYRGRTSKYLGVSFRHERNKWIATINVDGKSRRIGSFDSEEDAHKAYVEAKRKHHKGNTL